MIKDISSLKVGQKVRYQPKHYSAGEWENGIIKEIPEFAKDKNSPVGYNCVRVVYNCAGQWDKYFEYTSALTNIMDLKIGWRFLPAEKMEVF